MSWRTVVISNRAKLDYQMDFLVIRGESTQKIHLSEISVLIIENTAVSLTAYLLSELIKNKIKVIFCDEKRNPQSELIGYYGSHDTSYKVSEQVQWTENVKAIVWTEIVREKIRQQMLFLRELNKPEADLLAEYAGQLLIGDASNREGFAAKVYFNALFGKDFTRSDNSPRNAALNYGYSLVLSSFNREITANGYIKNYLNLKELQFDITAFLQNIIDQFSYPLDFSEELSINDLIKAADVKFNFGDQDLSEMLINYLSIMRDFGGKTVFFLCNLKSWIGNDDLMKFYKDVIYRKITIVLLENHVSEKSLDCEIYRIIDNDLCEVT